MRRTFKKILSAALVLVLLFMTTVPSYAAWGAEEYISELRLIYAEDYWEAKSALIEYGLKDYTVLNANLNGKTDKTGVFLAYKTTEDVEDAITDIAVMQMNGGYRDGNYQEMLNDSYQEYLEFGEIYLTAIDYFNKAYDAGNYLAEIAHRQLNFYNVISEDVSVVPDFEGERIGDIFYGGIDAAELATMFMEGNSYALDNIRSLISMGVSYNEDGMTYLEKVADEAEKYSADPNAYDNLDYYDLAAVIAPTIIVFKNMFRELSAHEDDLNYSDEEITEQELYYAEYKVMSEMAKATDYLGGKTFYDFCLEYQNDVSDYSGLYPLVAALNEGQLAMTMVNHYYDVVRYSMSLESGEEIDSQLNELEKIYAENPFNVYTGVDRSVFRDSFAVTNDAFRTDAATESGIVNALYKGKLSGLNIAATVIGSVGTAYLAYGLGKFGYSLWNAKSAIDTYQVQYDKVLSSFATKYNYTLPGVYDDVSIDYVIKNLCEETSILRTLSDLDVQDLTLSEQFAYLEKYCNAQVLGEKGSKYVDAFSQIKSSFETYQSEPANSILLSARQKAADATQNVKDSFGFLKGAAIIGGLMMLFSAIKLGIDIYNYYHPEYADIPTAMVDIIYTPDGDRYIKYDVVYEAEPQADGALIAGDLNAFSAERWNALYYTKSYEAGKPLLAGEFVVSNNNNVPEENYAPVHRFGEVVCYNLNKYNFNDDHTIYLSVKQSNNQKSAVKDVPSIVGSLFSEGATLIAGGAGALVGAAGTALVRKKKES